MKHVEDPYKQIGYLQQCLSSDKKPPGIFLGAGCPMAIRLATEGNPPLIPDIAGIRVNLDVGRLEELMISPFEISQAFHVGSSQPCEFSPLPDFSGWNEASFEKPVTQKTGQPLAVANIGLPSRNILYVSGIDQDDLHVAFEHIVNGSPVDPRTLHSHNWTIMLAQPVSHSDEIIGEGPEFLHLHPLTSKHAAHDQACRKLLLVNIEATTNRMHDVYNSVIILANHGYSPFFWVCGSVDG